MSLKAKIKVAGVLIVPIVGLTSCGSDKKDAEVNHYSGAPSIALVRKENGTIHVMNTATQLQSNDWVYLTDGSNITDDSAGSAAAGVASIHAVSQCHDVLGNETNRDEGVAKSGHYQVLDLVPIEALPVSYGIETQLPVICRVGLRFFNSAGSSHTSWLPAQQIDFDLSNPDVAINSYLSVNRANVYSSFEVDYKNTTDVFVLYEKAKSRQIRFNCTSYSGTYAVVGAAPFALSTHFLKEISDPKDVRRINPKQKCRVYVRDENLATHIGPAFTVKYPVNQSALASDLQIQAGSNYLSQRDVGFMTIFNDQPYPIQYRAHINPGTADVRLVAGRNGNFGISIPIQRQHFYRVDNMPLGSVVKTDKDYLVTLRPGESARFVLSAFFGMGCGSDDNIAGFDFGFDNPEAFQIERANVVVPANHPELFEAAEQLNIDFRNAVHVNGENRLTWSIEWAQHPGRGPMPLGGLPRATSCWN